MKVYISGSISNNPNYREQFKQAENFLREHGFVPLNPVKNLGFTYKEYMDMALNELMQCDAICLLEGWENSNGAKLELMYAKTVGLKVMHLEVL